jgi:octaprenyl-diphosphate synthase
MKKSLKDIKRIINKDLEKFDLVFRDTMSSKVALLDKITYYIVKSKGKQIRPILVFFSAKLFGTINDQTHRAASLLELVHTTSLVHDDVVDDSYERRGMFSINALWKNKIAVLVGDFLLSKGMILALKNKDFQILEYLSNAVIEMSEGELLQLEKARKLDIKEDIYFEIIRQKTASLISAACLSGASTTTSNADDLNKIRILGEKIGIAFQIKDDLFDFGNAVIGKPIGIDIKEKKMTLPLIYALSKCDNRKKKEIINIISNNNNTQESIDKVIQFVRDSGGLEYASSKMDAYKSEAFDILNQFENKEIVDIFSELIEFVTDREN